MPQYVRKLNHIMEAEQAARQRFYDWLPDGKKAEFINGEVIVHSPVKFEHSDVSDNLLTLMRSYVRKYELGHGGHEKLLVSLTRNDYEPDICYWCSAKSAPFKRKQMKFPAPDLIVEILSPSTQKIDRNIKFEDYAAHGIDEYWIVDPDECIIEQYLLAGDVYELAAKKKSGTIPCRTIKGLKIPVAAAFDARANSQALESIMKR